MTLPESFVEAMHLIERQQELLPVIVIFFVLLPHVAELLVEGTAKTRLVPTEDASSTNAAASRMPLSRVLRSYV